MQHIIGLSRQQCPCADTAPKGFNVSASGLYITDIEPFGMLDGLENCNEGSTWTMLTHAREEAVSRFRSDMSALMAQMYEPKRKNYKGVLGEQGDMKLTETTKNYVGFRLYVGSNKSGVLKIKGIGTHFERDGSIDVKVYNNLGELVYEIKDIDTKAGRLSTSPLNFTLPMHHDFTNALEYFFVYEHDPQNRAYNNKAHCGCGGFDPLYNIYSPYVSKTHTLNGRTWAQWLMIGSFEADTLNEFYNNKTVAKNRFNGLSLTVEMYCKSIDLIDDNDDLNFEKDPLLFAAATAIQYKAAEIMASKLLLSSNLNRAVMINREQIAAERTKWKNEYLNITRYLIESIDITQNDCFECKKSWKMSIGSIFS